MRRVRLGEQIQNKGPRKGQNSTLRVVHHSTANSAAVHLQCRVSHVGEDGPEQHQQIGRREPQAQERGGSSKPTKRILTGMTEF